MRFNTAGKLCHARFSSPCPGLDYGFVCHPRNNLVAIYTKQCGWQDNTKCVSMVIDYDDLLHVQYMAALTVYLLIYCIICLIESTDQKGQ